MGKIINIDHFYHTEENPVIMAKHLEKYMCFEENVSP